MSGCRTDARSGASLRALVLGTACLAGGLLSAAPLLAQAPAGATGQPLPLLVIPAPGNGAPAAAAPAAAPAAKIETPAAPAELPTVDPRDVAFTRQNLAAPPVGVLTAAQGGFPATLWAGTPAAAVRALLPLLPDLPSPTVHDLARRLLLTAATPPADATPADTAALAELRVSRLLALGQLDGARQLAESMPAAVNTPGLARLRWQAQLLSGRVTEACSALGAAGADADGEIAEGQVLCQLASGNTLGANLGIDVLRDRKPGDPAFLAAAETMAGLPPEKPVTALRDPTPLQFAAFRAAKLPLPAEAVETARPAVLAAIATSAEVAPDLRLAAAERAEALGIIGADTLRQQMAAVEFTPDDLAQPLARLGGMAPARALALLTRAAEAANDPAIRIALLGKALDLAEARGRGATAARLLAPQIAPLWAQPGFAAFAPAAARALLIAGKPEAAGPWLDLARQDPDGAKAAARLWPLARIWGIGDPAPAAVEDWLHGADPRRAANVLSLLAGLGQKIPESAWVTLLAVPRAGGGPGPAVAQLLAGMAHENHLGGTVLAVLAGFDSAGLDKTDPAALTQAVAALKAVGLETEARRLATEAVLAGGV